MSNHDIERIKNLLGTHPNFPKEVPLKREQILRFLILTVEFLQGIVFKDLFPVFQDPTAVEALISNIVHHINSTHAEKIDTVVGKSIASF